MVPLNIGLVITTKPLQEELRQALQPHPVRIVLEQEECGEWADFLDRIDRLQPDIVIIDLAALRISIEDFVKRLSTCKRPPEVVALSTEASPETILQAVRAGATEFLHPPVETALRNALDRISAHLVKSGGKSREGGKVLGFLGAKGGCGTTTAACHFALALSGLDQGKVLLADLDSSAGMVGFLMKSKSRYSIEDAASNTHRLDPSFWAALTSNGLPGLEVITAPPPVDNRGKATPESYRQVLNFLRTQYALTVVDLGRGLSALTLSVLDEIDETYLVTTMEVPALHQAKEIVQTLRLAGYGEKRLRLLLNRVPKNPEITQDELEGIFGLPVFGALPNDYQALYDAYAEGSLLPAEANLRRHIARMARKMAGVPEEPAKRRFSFLG